MTGRGQLVLVAAAVAALALVPVAAAYLQFGYAPGVAGVDEDHAERISRTLDRVTDDAAEAATGTAWRNRERAGERLRTELAPPLDTLEASRLRSGVAVNVTYDAALAESVSCPDGRGRSFGDCETLGGAVVQERDGETVVVAVAFAVRVNTPDGTLRFGHVARVR